MFLKKWSENALKKFDWIDMGLVKLSVFAFTLFLVKLWPPLHSLEWYWYAVLFLLAMIRPLRKMLK